jgi:hypothetical protein
MAKGKTTGQIIKEWIQFNFIPSCLSVQNEEQAAFIPAKLVRQGGMLDLFQSNEERLDEVNSRDSLVDGAKVNVIGIITNHVELE